MFCSTCQSPLHAVEQSAVNHGLESPFFGNPSILGNRPDFAMEACRCASPDVVSRVLWICQNLCDAVVSPWFAI